jgi:hypothetical protein
MTDVVGRSRRRLRGFEPTTVTPAAQRYPTSFMFGRDVARFGA